MFITAKSQSDDSCYTSPQNQNPLMRKLSTTLRTNTGLQKWQTAKGSETVSADNVCIVLQRFEMSACRKCLNIQIQTYWLKHV